MKVIEDFFNRYIRMPVSTMSWSDVLEILIFAVLIYYVILWFRRTRAWIFLKAAVLLLLVYLLADLLKLNNVTLVFRYITSYIVIGIIVILQPEIRRALEQLGKQMQSFRWFSFIDDGERDTWYSQALIDAVVRAAVDMGKTRTGALIVLEKNILLTEYIVTGISLNADVSAPLLEQIFEHNTPLHDGAVIIRENRILAATCYLPLSGNRNISKELGTRHRAGLGISEVSDCLTVIVSEESGAISVAREGQLERGLNAEALRQVLLSEQKKKLHDVTAESRRKGKTRR